MKPYDSKNRLLLTDSGTATDVPCYIGLFLVLLIVRLPSFFFSVFDWDESTLIIMGQSILNGNIPYVGAWDIKPPLAYYVYAFFIALLGKSIFSIRVGGLLCIYCASILLFRTGKAIHDRTAGIITALFLIVSVSSGPSGLSTMTEHILLVPISLILYLLLTVHIDRKMVFFIGTILGMSVLVKTNVLFEGMAVFILLAAGFLPPATLSERLNKCAILLAGICLPVLIMIYYYFANNELDLLLKTNFSAVFKYIGSEGSLPKKAEIFFRNIDENIRLNFVLWITFLPGVLFLGLRRKRSNPYLSLALVIFVAQLFSLFLSGQPFGYHYLITSMPVLCLVSGVALSYWVSEKKTGRTINYLVTIMILVAGLFYSLQGNVVKHYREIISHLIQKQPLFNDSCYKIADFLETKGVKDHYIYMVNSCQIVYWLTESRYPTKYIHPSNLLIKEYMLRIIDGPDATKEKELRAIFDKHPVFIIHRADLWPEKPESFKTILDFELRTNYELVKTIDTYYVIFKRREGTPSIDLHPHYSNHTVRFSS